jgi:Tfp pilus assembly PilM family ATPase/Tfp pilus assembly protein PilN
MPELLAVEWEHAHVCGVLAQVAPGRVRVTRTFVVPRPVTSITGSGPLQIDWLKPELVKLGIYGGQVLVALPRDEAVVKRVELPDVSDDELPVMVRFQAGAKSSVALDELSLDFLPLPRRSEMPGREVLMATISRQTLDEVTTVCQTAGLEAKVIGLTAAAVAEFVARAESQISDVGGESLVVARHGNRVEISVLRRSHLVFSHSSRLPDEASGQEAQAIVSEVSRALVALRGAVADVKIDRVWTLVGLDEHDHLAEALHRRLACDVRPLDPFAEVECDRQVTDAISDRSLFAGPLGMLLANSDPRVPAIDFLSPRRPPVKRDERKRRAVLAGASVAVLLVILGIYQWYRVAELDTTIAALDQETRDVDEKIKKGEPATNAEGLVAQWQADGDDWLDELAELTRRMPSTERVYLQKIVCTPKSGTLPAVIRLEGLARERDDALELNKTFLAKGDRYQGLPVTETVAPKEVEYYRSSFTKLIRLTNPPAKDTKGRQAGNSASPSNDTSAGINGPHHQSNPATTGLPAESGRASS